VLRIHAGVARFNPTRRSSILAVVVGLSVRSDPKAGGAWGNSPLTFGANAVRANQFELA
jgi:hypothetical protein